MELTPREKDKLLLFTAGLLAERRKEKAPDPLEPHQSYEGARELLHFWRERARDEARLFADPDWHEPVAEEES